MLCLSVCLSVCRIWWRLKKKTTTNELVPVPSRANHQPLTITFTGQGGPQAPAGSAPAPPAPHAVSRHLLPCLCLSFGKGWERRLMRSDGRADNLFYHTPLPLVPSTHKDERTDRQLISISAHPNHVLPLEADSCHQQPNLFMHHAGTTCRWSGTAPKSSRPCTSSWPTRASGAPTYVCL